MDPSAEQSGECADRMFCHRHECIAKRSGRHDRRNACVGQRSRRTRKWNENSVSGARALARGTRAVACGTSFSSTEQRVRRGERGFRSTERLHPSSERVFRRRNGVSSRKTRARATWRIFARAARATLRMDQGTDGGRTSAERASRCRTSCECLQTELAIDGAVGPRASESDSFPLLPRAKIGVFAQEAVSAGLRAREHSRQSGGVTAASMTAAVSFWITAHRYWS